MLSNRSRLFNLYPTPPSSKSSKLSKGKFTLTPKQHCNKSSLRPIWQNALIASNAPFHVLPDLLSYYSQVNVSLNKYGTNKEVNKFKIRRVYKRLLFVLYFSVFLSSPTSFIAIILLTLCYRLPPTQKRYCSLAQLWILFMTRNLRSRDIDDAGG